MNASCSSSEQISARNSQIGHCASRWWRRFGLRKWPLLAGFFRLSLTVMGGWMALRLTGSLVAFFSIAGAAMLMYGVTIVAAILSGTWFRGERGLSRPLAASAIEAATEGS